MGFIFEERYLYMKIAILVDGGYYRKRSATVLGHKDAKERADELYRYCNRHLKETSYGDEIRHDLYRIFITIALRLTNKFLIL